MPTRREEQALSKQEIDAKLVALTNERRRVTLPARLSDIRDEIAELIDMRLEVAF